MFSGKQMVKKPGSRSRFFKEGSAKGEKDYKKFIFEQLTTTPNLTNLSYRQFYTKYSKLLELSQTLRPGEIIQNHKPNYNGYTPLILATRRNLEILVMTLLNSNKLLSDDINVIGVGGIAALHCAARNGNIPLIRTMILLGASFDLLTDDRYSALHFAAMSGNIEVVKLVYEQCGKRMQWVTTLDHQLTPLHLSCKQGDVPSIKFLLKQMNKKETRELINNWRDINYTPLFLAVESGSVEAVQMLLPYYKGMSFDEPAARGLLVAAASSGNASSYALIKDSIPSVKAINSNKNLGRSILSAAISSGNTRIIDYLFFTGEVTQADMKGMTIEQVHCPNKMAMVNTLLKYASLEFLNQSNASRLNPITGEKTKKVITEPMTPTQLVVQSGDIENLKLPGNNPEQWDEIELTEMRRMDMK